MNRRLLIVIIVAAVLILLGAIFFFGVNQTKQKNLAASLSVDLISNDQVISPVSSFDGNTVWYFNQTGHLFRAQADGSGLTEYPLPAYNGDVRNVLWPATGPDFLLQGELDTQTSVSLAYYDDASKSYTFLPNNIASIDWMPDGKRVLYVWKSGDNASQSLVLANSDGTGFTTIAPLLWSDLVVKVSPDGKTALLLRANSNAQLNKIYLVDLATGQFSTAVDTGGNLDAKWLPDGQSFLYTQTKSSSTYPELYQYDLNSKSSRDLDEATTMTKVAVEPDNQTVDMAIPKSDNTGDNFIKLNLENLKSTNYFTPTTPVHAAGLFLLGHTIYFINSSNGELYSIQ